MVNGAICGWNLRYVCNSIICKLRDTMQARNSHLVFYSLLLHCDLLSQWSLKRKYLLNFKFGGHVVRVQSEDPLQKKKQLPISHMDKLKQLLQQLLYLRNIYSNVSKIWYNQLCPYQLSVLNDPFLSFVFKHPEVKADPVNLILNFICVDMVHTFN